MFNKDTKTKAKPLTEEERKKQIEEEALFNDVYTKFENAKTAKSEKVTLWNKCLEAYNSKLFINKEIPEYKSTELSNFIFSTIEAIKPVMVDNNPTILALPQTPKALGVIDKIQNTFNNEWQREDMMEKLIKWATTTLQIGTGIISVLWEGKSDNGLGNVKIDVVNPFNIFPDPIATSFDDAEYIIYASYKHVNLLKTMFPKKADQLTGSAINYAELVGNEAETSTVKNQVLVIECWQSDYSSEEFMEEQDGKQVKVMKRKYPNGKIVTIAPELDLLLETKANIYVDALCPFVMMKCYDIPFEFWGKGEIEAILSPQTYINELTNQIIDNAKLTGNMPWVIDKNAGIAKGALTNRPGLIIRKTPGTEVKRLQPLPMPSYIQEMINNFKNDIEVISGIHDVTRGQTPGSVTAASAIMALQEAGQARIRLKTRNMELSLSKVGKKMYSRWRQFWKTNRTFRNDKEFTNKSMQDVDVNNAFMEITPDDLQVDVDFYVVGGSSMPTNKSAMLDLMIRLAQTQAEDGLPMVDRATLLSYTNIPELSNILDHFKVIDDERKGIAQQDQQVADSKEQEALMREQEMQQAQMELEHKKVASKQSMINPDEDPLANLPPELLQQVMAYLQQNQQGAETMPMQQ